LRTAERRIPDVATPLGFEPRITPPKGAVLPLHHGVFQRKTLDWPFWIAIGKMPDELGFEPRITPKAFGAVLPLHHGVCGLAILDWRFSIQAQRPKLECDWVYAEQLAAKIEVESLAAARV
jgi:hypothetical protein